MRYLFISFLFIVVATLSIFGLRGKKVTHPPIEVFPDMDRQPKFHPQAESTFFPDTRSERPVPAGTIPHITALQQEYEFLQPKDRFYEDSYLATGKNGAEWGRGFPLPVTNTLIKRGRVMFDRYCSVCHGLSGNGNGVTKSYGMVATASLLDERIRKMPEGEIFNTITHGKNSMFPYGSKLAVQDRWAVISYLRALQLSQMATASDIPAEKRKELGL